MKRLLIVQPYIPDYRVPLFKMMKEVLAQQGIEMKVAAAVFTNDNVSRGDMSDKSEIDFVLKTRRIPFKRREVNFRRLSPVIREYKPDFIILEQVVKNIEVYPLILRIMFGSHLRIAFWGHGKSFSTSQSQWLARLKQMLTRKGDWFFAYTEEGAEFVIQHGFPRNQVTVLNNSSDTESLRQNIERIASRDVTDFQKSLGLTPGMTGLFLGGVDRRKGIDLLLEAAKLIHSNLPDFRLLVAGEGSESWKVQDLEEASGFVLFLGRVIGLEKALVLSASSVLLIPEWVGLVALDSLVSGRPILTTNTETHSPEYSYLVPERNCRVSLNTAMSYSDMVVQTLERPSLISEMRANAMEDSSGFSIENMAAKFCSGIWSWINRD